MRREGIALRAISIYAALGGSAAKGSENHTTLLRSLEMHPFPRRGKSALRFPVESYDTLLSIHSPTVHILHRMCKSGEVRCLACP